MSANDFFTSKKAAAVFKHGILKRYPVVFASKTGSKVEGGRVVFLDGYAGRGEYDGGEPGSPLLLSRCAEYVSESRNVLGVFVEQNDDNFANLQRVLDEKGGDTQRVLLHGSVDEHLPEVLRRANGAALFAFLDPFGPALDFDLVKTALLGRPPWPPTEVLLHFSVLSVARMAVPSTSPSPADTSSPRAIGRPLNGWTDFLAAVGGKTSSPTSTMTMMRRPPPTSPFGSGRSTRETSGTGLRTEQSRCLYARVPICSRSTY